VFDQKKQRRDTQVETFVKSKKEATENEMAQKFVHVKKDIKSCVKGSVTTIQNYQYTMES